MQMTGETSILVGFLALVLLSLIAVMAKALRRRALQNAARLAAPPLPQIDETQTHMLRMLSGIEADVKRMAILQVGLAQRLDAIEKSVNGEKHAPAVANLLPPPNPSDIAEQSLGRSASDVAGKCPPPQGCKICRWVICGLLCGHFKSLRQAFF